MSDGQLVVRSQQRGRAVHPGQPLGAGQPGHRARGDRAARRGPRPAGRRAPLGRGRDRPATDRCLRLRGRWPDGPARDHPPHAGRVDGLSRRQRPGAVRRPLRTTRSWRSRRSRSTRSSSATSRRWSSPATRRPRSAWRAFRRRYDLPVLGVDPAGCGRGRARDAQPAGRRDRHAGDDPLARLFQRDQGREPGGRGVRARDAGARPARRGRRRSSGQRRGARRSPRRWRRCVGERDADGESIFPRPPGAAIDTLLLGCTHYPLLRPLIADLAGDRGRDRRLGDRHGLGARRAAERQRPRGGSDATDAVAARRPTSSSRPVIRSGSPISPAGCSARSSCRSRRSSSERWPDDQAPTRARLGATTAPGRPGILIGLGARRRRDRRRSPAWSAARARAWSTGRPSSGWRSVASTARRAR